MQHVLQDAKDSIHVKNKQKKVFCVKLILSVSALRRDLDSLGLLGCSALSVISRTISILGKSAPAYKLWRTIMGLIQMLS